MKNCLVCGKSFLPRGDQRFCSRGCSNHAKRGENHPRYRGGVLRKDGYKLLSINGRRILEHRHIMEELIGRRLESKEIVHHLNENRADNRPENLELLPSQTDHVAKHYKGFRSETHKQCRKCLAIKPRMAFDSNHNPAQKDSSSSWCKDCRAKYNREYQSRHS
jgi:hypothetical protein